MVLIEANRTFLIFDSTFLLRFTSFLYIFKYLNVVAYSRLVHRSLIWIYESTIRTVFFWQYSKYMNNILVKQFFLKLHQYYYIIILNIPLKLYEQHKLTEYSTWKWKSILIKKILPFRIIQSPNSSHNTRDQFKPRVTREDRPSEQQSPNLQTRLAKSTRWTRFT